MNELLQSPAWETWLAKQVIPIWLRTHRRQGMRWITAAKHLSEVVDLSG